MRGRDRSSQAGTTLLESLLVVVLVGVLILTLATGLLASTVGARRVNNSQRLSLAITSISETMRQMKYRPASAGCTSAGDAGGYLADYLALPADQRTATSGLTVEVVSVKYWKLAYTTTTLASTPQWSTTCVEAGLVTCTHGPVGGS